MIRWGDQPQMKETGMKKDLQRTQQSAPAQGVSQVIGIDLGDRWSRYCIVDEIGEIVEEGRVQTSDSGFGQRFQKIATTRIIVEAGTHSPWVSRLLHRFGHEVVVANARKVRLIYESDRKNDRLDARMLARLGRVDINLLAPIRHRGAEAQADLAVIRGRDSLVATRTQLINAIRGMVKSVGGRLPKSTTAAFAGKADSTGTENRGGPVVEEHHLTERANRESRPGNRPLGGRKVSGNATAPPGQRRRSADCADLRADSGRPASVYEEPNGG
jgi:hypothetical protein